MFRATGRTAIESGCRTELRIQRFTPQVTKLFDVMPNDRGRPIAHLTQTIEYPSLASDAERVLRELAPVEREVRGPEATWYLVRLRPYRTVKDVIEGVVLTFVDISRRRRRRTGRRR